MAAMSETIKAMTAVMAQQVADPRSRGKIVEVIFDESGQMVDIYRKDPSKPAHANLKSGTKAYKDAYGNHRILMRRVPGSSK